MSDVFEALRMEAVQQVQDFNAQEFANTLLGVRFFFCAVKYRACAVVNALRLERIRQNSPCSVGCPMEPRTSCVQRGVSNGAPDQLREVQSLCSR